MSVMSLREVRGDPNIWKRGRFAVPTFCGWPAVMEYHKQCPTPEIAGLFSVLFETGCRISEALQLHREMFVYEAPFLKVYRLPVMKKKERAPIGDRFRNISIPLQEPLVEPMMKYVGSKPGRLFSRSRVWAWRKIVEVDDRWWPHRIRSERATQLNLEYGFDISKLMKWFNWVEAKEAQEYVRLDMRDLEKAMMDRLKSHN